MTLLRFLALLWLVVGFLGPGHAGAQAEQPGATASGLCGLVYTGSPRCAPGWTISGTAGYGATKLGGLHHRAIGTLGVAYVPLDWLAISIEFAGRMDFHPSDERGGKHMSATGDPWLRGRVGWPLQKRLLLGGELGLWLPGNTAPSYSPKATTIDLKALLSWTDPSEAWTLLALAGMRVDNSASSAPDPARLRYGDRIALGLSEAHGLLLGLGLMRKIQAVQVFAELSAQLLLGAKAPGLASSPLRAAVGARYFFSDSLSAELSVIPVFSQRPNTGATAPLAPIEPRVSVLAGVRYQRLAKAKQLPIQDEQIKEDPTARDEPAPVAALRGSLTDEAGAPLPDATVLLNDSVGEQKESVSQGDGTYVFQGLKPGKATLSVTAPGFQPHMWEVEVKAPLTQLGAEQLSAVAAAAGSLRCLVRSFKSEPLKANIVVRDGRGRRVASGSTDAAGLWEYTLPPGEYRVMIDASGYQSRKSNVRVAPNEVAVLNIDLRENR